MNNSDNVHYANPESRWEFIGAGESRHVSGPCILFYFEECRMAKWWKINGRPVLTLNHWAACEKASIRGIYISAARSPDDPWCSSESSLLISCYL